AVWGQSTTFPVAAAHAGRATWSADATRDRQSVHRGQHGHRAEYARCLRSENAHSGPATARAPGEVLARTPVSSDVARESVRDLLTLPARRRLLSELHRQPLSVLLAWSL